MPSSLESGLAIPRAIGVLAGAAAVIVAVILLIEGTGPALPDPVYVGRAACAPCHEAQVERWSGSHHDLAMQQATEQKVLGDFDDATFVHQGVTTTFFRRDNGFYVRTDGPDGQLADFEARYTFGVYPLQQYLVALPGGRYQALSIAWDSRPEDQGGQRWFHLYPETQITPGHPLHWTQPRQNWNRTCAGCHSTNLDRGFDLDSRSYETTWTEIDVSCEACHGPASNHVTIAESAARNGSRRLGEWGIVANGRDASRRWTIRPGETIARREEPRPSNQEIETCAHCHARRTTHTERYVPGQALLQTDIVSLLRDDLYHPDGQILDEVYEYGSFLQSRMYRAGVTCSDCHDPHSLQTVRDGNALCSQCHLTNIYDTPSHHFHENGTEGAQCVECHMPARTYMVIDGRRDHSLRIPRPDLTVTIDVPNPCTDCHVGRSNAWAAETLAEWYGPRDETSTHFGEVFHAARMGNPAALTPLTELARDTSHPTIVRATAYTLMPRYPSIAQNVIQAGLADTSALVRLGAVQALGAWPGVPMRALAVPLIDDSVRSVRIEAARVLTTNPTAQWTADQRSAIDSAIAEYELTQLSNADHPASWLNLGNLYADRGEIDNARDAYETAIAIDSLYLPARLNLADFYRATGRDNLGESVLLHALERFPDAGEVHHAIGLLRVRQRKAEEALRWLERATSLSPNNARFAYVYGVALASAGNVTRAINVLESALRRHPFDQDIRDALEAYRMRR